MNLINSWNHISFAHPWVSLLLLLLPLMVWWQLQRKNTATFFRISSIQALSQAGRSWRVKLRPVLFLFRLLTLATLIIALARPQTTNTAESVNSEGIDIVLSIDISGSMLAEDLQPNRLEASRNMALDFVSKRRSDRMGLVVFAGESFTQCPLTIDHDVLKTQLNAIKSGALVDGTAIGEGLATAVDRIRRSDGKSKIVILLTDGENNTGKIGPELALEVAKTFGVKVYTIGVGSKGTAPFPMQTPLGIQKQMVEVRIDEDLLKKIAAETGGKYYRATDNKSLSNIYEEIDQLEKTQIEISSFKQYNDLFFPFAMIALLCLLLELSLRYTVFRSIN